MTRLFHLLAEPGRPVSDPSDAARRLADLRRTYEPYVHALGERLLMPLPAWTSSRASSTRTHADD